MIKCYTDLFAWQKAMLLSERVYQITSGFPKEEVYGLTNQIRRASVSIPSNIAEGLERKSDSSFKSFLHISQGSRAELETQIILAERLSYMNEIQKNELIALSQEVGKLINGLIRSLG